MTAHIRILSSWKTIQSMHIRISGSWKNVISGFIRIGSQWKQFFSSLVAPTIQQQVTISQFTDSGSGFVTLTGTNYHWTNSTSLTYFFEWSTDGGSTWFTINTGSITNPSSGSSNTKTYEVQISNTSPNIDNLYRFRVFAQNSTLSTSSTSNSTTISTPRNITISFYSKTFNSITVQFNTPAYAGSYQIRIGSNTYQSVLGTVVGGQTRVTASNLNSSTSYDIRVTPYTGGLGSTLGVAFNKGYPGNESNSINATTDAPPLPIQNSAPSAPIGSGLVFTAMSSGSSGTYNNIVGSPTTVLINLIRTTTPTNGSTTPQGTVRSNLYEVTQLDARETRQNFYTRDAVTGLNGTIYYYYSSPITAFVGTVTDNFNRVVSSGLGTSSSQYVYSSYSNLSSSWSTNGSVANNSTAVAFATAATNYPLQTMEVNNPNRTYSIGIPNGNGGGIGVAYWVTGSGSWWATIPYYTFATSTTNTCNTPVTSYSCNTPVTSSSCTGSAISTDSSGTGCGGCAVSSSTSTTFTWSTVASSTTTTFSCGPIVNESSDPGTVVTCTQASDVGKPCSKFFVGEFGVSWQVSRCGSSSSTQYTCDGAGSGSSCPTSFTFEPGPTNVGTRCSECTSSTTTSYSCNTLAESTSCSGSAISTDSSGTGCGGCPVTESTSCSGSAISTDSSGTGCGGCPVSSATSTTYFTFLDIVSSGSLMSTKQLTSNTFSGFYSSAGYSRIYSHSTIINNNTITARGFNSSGVQIGTDLVYTASSPTKTGVLGDTSAGVIKGHTNDLNGNAYDNLSMQ
jgi:hypothetical protein